nr:DUF4129 domain-containing protein [Lentibacillus sp. JNUCC-1]
MLVVALLGITIWLVVRSAGRKRKFGAHPPLEAGNELSWSWQKHLAKADDFSDKGDFAEATRHVFLALLLYFDEIEWVKARSWKTNWEYFAELKRVDKNGAEAFQRLALIFDQVFYGGQSMERADYERYRKEADQWLELERLHQKAES